MLAQRNFSQHSQHSQCQGAPLREARGPAEIAKWNKIYVIKHMQIHIIISDSFWRNLNVFYISCKGASNANGKFFQRLLPFGPETQENKPINQVSAFVQYWHICCFHKKYISTTPSANLFWQMLWSCQIWEGGRGGNLETVMQNSIIKDVSKRTGTTVIVLCIWIFKNSSSGLHLKISRHSRSLREHLRKPHCSPGGILRVVLNYGICSQPLSLYEIFFFLAQKPVVLVTN